MEQVARHRDLGDLEDDVPGMRDDLGADLDELLPQALGGYLAITRWLKLPPRDSLKLFATALAALERKGIGEPGRRLALIRSWNTTTLIVKNGPLTAEDVARSRTFAAERSFDLDYYPGIERAEADRFNVLDQPYFFEGAAALQRPDRQTFPLALSRLAQQAPDLVPWVWARSQC